MAQGVLTESGAGLRGATASAVLASPLARAAALGAVGFATRLPLRGVYLFNWDALQFALGMQHFVLAAHRPHPPGYIGYIWLGRVLTPLAGGDVQAAMSLLSTVAAGLTVAAAYLAGRRLAGEFAGVAAAVVTLTSPLFWFYGETALTYGLEPLLSLAGFWLALRARRGTRLDVAAAGLGVGLMGAIRPSCELFLVPVLAVATLRRTPAWRMRRPDAALLAAGLAAGTAAWLLPLLAWSGGPIAYLEAGLQLGKRVSGGSALWSAGLGGLALNLQGVLDGLLLSAGPLLAVALAWGAAGILSRRPGGAPAPPGRREHLLLGSAWVAPALATFTFVHIGQLAYVLYALPAIALLAGPVLLRFAAVVRPGAGARPLAAYLLAGGALASLAMFLTPMTNLAAEIHQRDSRVATLRAEVARHPAASTLLLTDPEGPGSYRTAQYYLPEYAAVAVGRDARGRAGEMFADHGGAPEYSLARFDRAGPLRLPPARVALVLDATTLDVLVDAWRLTPIPLGDDLHGRVYSFPIDWRDPPLAHGPYLYARASDCAVCAPAASRGDGLDRPRGAR